MPLFKGISHSESKSVVPEALERNDEGKGNCGSRVVVSIKRRSTHLLDRDNLWGSCTVLINRLRACHLIPNDDEIAIDLRVTQEKVKTRKECGTFVEIIYP